MNNEFSCEILKAYWGKMMYAKTTWLKTVSL